MFKNTLLSEPFKKFCLFWEYIKLFVKILENFQILRIFDFFFFFGNFRWIYNLILPVFLICQNSSEFLCATCPNIKIFIGDNSLMHKVPKFSLLDIIEHLAWKNSFFLWGYQNGVAKSTLFLFGWIRKLILHVFSEKIWNFWSVQNFTIFVCHMSEHQNFYWRQ